MEFNFQETLKNIFMNLKNIFMELKHTEILTNKSEVNFEDGKVIKVEEKNNLINISFQQENLKLHKTSFETKMRMGNSSVPTHFHHFCLTSRDQTRNP